jgi:hypothetical protein
MIDTAFVILQDFAYVEKLRGRCSEVCPTSHDAYQAINIKAEVLSDAEEKEDPFPVTFLGIMAEPEVSCVSMTS